MPVIRSYALLAVCPVILGLSALAIGAVVSKRPRAASSASA
jgi:hypothetical protein